MSVKEWDNAPADLCRTIFISVPTHPKVVEARRSFFALVSLSILMGHLTTEGGKDAQPNVLVPLYIEAACSVLLMGCVHGVGTEEDKERGDSPGLVAAVATGLLMLSVDVAGVAGYTVVVLPLFLFLVADVTMAIRGWWLWKSELHSSVRCVASF